MSISDVTLTPTPSLLSTPRHEQSPLPMLLTKLHLSHIVKCEVLSCPSANEYLPDALLREPMVRHRPQGLLVRSNMDLTLISMAMSMRIVGVVVVVMIMMVIMTT